MPLWDWMLNVCGENINSRTREYVLAMCKRQQKIFSSLALNLHGTSLLISYTNSLLQYYVIVIVVLSFRGEVGCAIQHLVSLIN